MAAGPSRMARLGAGKQSGVPSPLPVGGDGGHNHVEAKVEVGATISANSGGQWSALESRQARHVQIAGLRVQIYLSFRWSRR